MYKILEGGMILRLDDNANIPPDPENSDYQEFLNWGDNGGIPEPEFMSTQLELGIRVMEPTKLKEVAQPTGWKPGARNGVYHGDIIFHKFATGRVLEVLQMYRERALVKARMAEAALLRAAQKSFTLPWMRM